MNRSSSFLAGAERQFEDEDDDEDEYDETCAR